MVVTCPFQYFGITVCGQRGGGSGLIRAPVGEMPHGISLPLATIIEVEEFEDWLKDTGNHQAKYGNSLFFLSIMLSIFNFSNYCSSGSNHPTLTVFRLYQFS